MFKQNWFKLTIVATAIFFVLSVFNYQNKKFSTEKRLQIFKTCINTVDPDVLRNYQALRANIELCDKLSSKFK